MEGFDITKLVKILTTTHELGGWEQLQADTILLGSFVKTMCTRDLYTLNTVDTQTKCHITHSIINLV